MEGPYTGARESKLGVEGLPYEVDLKGRWMGHPFVVFTHTHTHTHDTHTHDTHVTWHTYTHT